MPSPARLDALADCGDDVAVPLNPRLYLIEDILNIVRPDLEATKSVNRCGQPFSVVLVANGWRCNSPAQLVEQVREFLDF